MDLVVSYKNYLNSKNYAGSSVRNYLCDLQHFISFYQTKSDDQNYNHPTVIKEYIDFIKKDPNSNRYLSTLKNFFDFAQDQNIIKTNPLKEVLKTSSQGPNITQVVSDYKEFLQKKHKTSLTIKNYIADIQQFITFCESK